MNAHLLPDAASKAGWELRKAVERIERIERIAPLATRDTLDLLRDLDARRHQPLTLGNRTRIADIERELARRAWVRNVVDPVVFTASGGAA